MQIHDFLRYGEAKPIAAHLARARLVHAVEPVEYLLLVLFRYAYARVRDAERRLVLLRRCEAYRDGAAVGRVLHGVVNEYQHELLYLLLIDPQRYVLFRVAVTHERYVLLLRERLHDARRLVCRLREIDL